MDSIVRVTFTIQEGELSREHSERISNRLVMNILYTVYWEISLVVGCIVTRAVVIFVMWVECNAAVGLTISDTS